MQQGDRKQDQTIGALPRKGYAVFGEGSKNLSVREIQDALHSTARLALFTAGQIALDHDEVEQHMARIMDLLEVAHDASPKARE